MSVFKEMRCHQASAGSLKTGWCRQAFTATTTDATATTFFSIPIAELEGAAIEIRGASFKSDATAALAHRVLNLARRAAAGNVTVGTTNSQLVEDSAGSPTLTIVANAGTQAVDCKVTGVASETWKWEMEVTWCVIK